jgi:hypothetical protein
MLHSAGALPPHHGIAADGTGHPPALNAAANNAAIAAAQAAGYPVSAQHIPALPNTQFSPQYNYTNMSGSGSGGGPAEGQAQVATDGASYDPMFGALPTNAFSSPSAWQGDDGSRGPSSRAVQSPDGRSNNGSTEAGSIEEKDPFLSLLEELAENEHARGPGNELDFFLSAAPNAC